MSGPVVVSSLGSGPYEPRSVMITSKDFASLAALGQAPQILVVHPSLPAKSVQEFLDLARKKPNGLICGSGGVGTPAHCRKAGGARSFPGERQRR